MPALGQIVAMFTSQCIFIITTYSIHYITTYYNFHANIYACIIRILVDRCVNHFASVCFNKSLKEAFYSTSY